MALTGNGQVFIYVNSFPQKVGDGSNQRCYSNVRAFLDQGCRVEVVEIAFEPSERKPSEDLAGLTWDRVVVPATRQSLLGRVMYRAGSAGRHACQFYFRKTDAVCQAVLERERRVPGALHVLECDAIANAAPLLRVRKICSFYDIAESAIGGVTKISCELENRQPSAGEIRELRFCDRIQRRMVSSSDLVLCISETDRDLFRSLGSAHAEYLPMSIPDESGFIPRAARSGNGHLNLLHLGKLAHLPTYRSLEVIFASILPNLDAETRKGLQIRIAGRYDPGSPRCQRILPLIESHPETLLLGFVDDLAREFANCDALLLASGSGSGLQTRIIEAFAMGLPVLCTALAARGIEGLEPGRNIIVCETAEDLACEVRELMQHPERLAEIARSARATYERIHSRRAVAQRLKEHLSRYFPLFIGG
jgi:glycosyltransferase involved in cell wall biosynthesis